MQLHRDNYLFAVFFSFALHAAVFALVSNTLFDFQAKPAKDTKEQIIFAQVLPPPVQPVPPQAKAFEATKATVPPPASAPTNTISTAAASLETAIAEKQEASMAAPPAPTAEEWSFAAKYTQKNSKGYRYSWGQQVRSMMGTAVEGPDQGVVRFRIEIAPDGTLSRLDTLWTTSAVAEQLARKAIEAMPPLPPTPTGKPLIFDKTISFTPYANDGPPSYKDDCLPDPPAFRNRFVWDGKSPQVHADPEPQEKLDPQAMEECLRQLPRDSIEAEMARDQRIMDQWGSRKQGR
ncbi:MAG: hypothetical protein RJA34_2249 [Pseudomonadota bacterium]|jgi:hypothetical protein